MRKEKTIPLAGSLPCLVTMLDRGVQPAALIARLTELRDRVAGVPSPSKFRQGQIYGLSRAIELIKNGIR